MSDPTNPLHGPNIPPPGAFPRRPEIVAPAGSEEAMRAAVENGADAVYFGLSDFNARMRASNFTPEKLHDIVAWLHERGVKAYVTLNTLIFTRELGRAAEMLRLCSETGVDAVMIQDLGLAALAGRMVPELPVYASTQMTLTAPESVEAARALGLRITRIVAARELNFKELDLLHRETGVELEVFVHGALCISYSGQCLASMALGGRSANRGQCAQACRLPFDLIVNGRAWKSGEVNYPLSPRDLATYDFLHRILEAGACALKIEGRLKTPLYVAAVVRAYREALEQIFSVDENERTAPRLDAATRRAVEQTFSRGFTRGYLNGTDFQALVEGKCPKNRGIYLGRVSAVAARGITVRLEGPLKPGDGVVFDAGAPEGDEEGGRVYELWRGGTPLATFDPERDSGAGADILLTFGAGCIQPRRIHPGDRVWKTSDPELESALAATYAPGSIHFRRPVYARLSGRVGEPVRLRFEDGEGVCVEVEDVEPAGLADRRPLTREVAWDQLDRLGNTPFHLDGLEFAIEGGVMVPFRRLNDLRRRGIEALLARRRERGRNRCCKAAALEEMLLDKMDPTDPTDPTDPSDAKCTPLFSALCRTLEQVAAAAGRPELDTIYTDFDNVRLHREARALIAAAGKRFAPATLQIMKPGEATLTLRLLDMQPDAVLVRHLAGWHVLRYARPELELRGDASLHVANPLTAKLLRRGGFRRLTPGFDLPMDHLLELLRAVPGEWFEVPLYHRPPLFHAEYCLFCRFLGTGINATHCGRPCEKHALGLRDRKGVVHSVTADAACRNTVFAGEAQSMFDRFDALLDAGVWRFRIEFVNETAREVRAVCEALLALSKEKSS
jgi:putative protease